MNHFIIANVIAPTLLINSVDHDFIFISVILGIPLVEWLAILLSCKGKLKVNKIAILYLTFIANFISGFLGSLLRVFARLVYLPFNESNLPHNFAVSAIAFTLSIFLEYWMYWRYKPFKQNQKTGFRAAVVANLTSYSLIIIYLTTISLWYPQPVKYNVSIMESHIVIRDIIEAQKAFYSRNNQFTSNFNELNNKELVVDEQNNAQAKTYHFTYTLKSDRATVEITLIPNKKTEYSVSYITLLRSQPFSSQTCQFRADTPLASPQIVEGEIQCPPGSQK